MFRYETTKHLKRSQLGFSIFSRFDLRHIRINSVLEKVVESKQQVGVRCFLICFEVLSRPTIRPLQISCLNEKFMLLSGGIHGRNMSYVAPWVLECWLKLKHHTVSKFWLFRHQEVRCTRQDAELLLFDRSKHLYGMLDGSLPPPPT